MSSCALQWTNDPVPVPTTSGKKIALEAPSTLTPLEDSASPYLIPLGSLQGAVSAFTCCGSPLAVIEDRNQRRGLVSKLSIYCSVCGKSSAITDPYQKKDLETTKSVLAMRAKGKGGLAWRLFLAWCCLQSPKECTPLKPEVVCCLRWRVRGLLCWCCCRAKEGCAWGPSSWQWLVIVAGPGWIPVSLLRCSGGIMEDWKSAGCGSTEQALPGLCHTPWNGYLLWWIFGLVGGLPGFMRGKLLWFILRDGVNWSPCNLKTVCEQE